MCNLCQNDLKLMVPEPVQGVPDPEPEQLKLWQIENFFRCPVIGSCMTLSEQKQILKKAGVSFKDKSAFEIHEILVAGTDNENRVSQKTDRLLNRKYGRRCAVLFGLTESEFMHQWALAFAGGNYLAEFWAAATRHDLSERSRRQVFAAIHMAMHENGHRLARALVRLNDLENRRADQNAQIRQLGQDRRILQKQNKGLSATIDGLQRRLLVAEQRIARLHSPTVAAPPPPVNTALERQNQELAAALADRDKRLGDNARQLAALSGQVERLTRQVTDHQQAETVLKHEAEQVLHALMEMNRCDTACPAFSLCRKRVLIVGGISRMEALYRRLIETSGGVFDYHDGYVNGGTRQLEDRLKRSDIVLCPVNCNSHAACALVKNLGKKHNKPVHMLASFSLSAVSRAIRGGDTGLVAEQ